MPRKPAIAVLALGARLALSSGFQGPASLQDLVATAEGRKDY